MNGEAKQERQEPTLENLINALNEQVILSSENLCNTENKCNRLNDYMEPPMPEREADIEKEPITIIQKLRMVIRNLDHNNGRLRVINDRLSELVG